MKRDIVVNAPLRYKGINIFQSSYGKLPPDRLTLKFKILNSGTISQVQGKSGSDV